MSKTEGGRRDFDVLATRNRTRDVTLDPFPLNHTAKIGPKSGLEGVTDHNEPMVGKMFTLGRPSYVFGNSKKNHPHSSNPRPHIQNPWFGF